jgi:16S rRNA (guanine527-N7)-methyltransferase
MSNEDFLKETAALIKINLSEFHMKQFEKYEELLLEWNEKINLTAIIEEKDIITKHFIDSLTCMKYIKENDKVIDVGTGAGFPGIPLRIINESINLTLLDALNKRIVYLNDVIEKLNLKNVIAIHGRAEELGRQDQYREKYDVVTARAVANLRVLSEYCLPFVKKEGIFICMKGPDVKEEMEEAKEQIKILGGEIVEEEHMILPNTDIGRTIVLIKKIASTPSKYPRKKI